MSQHLVEGMGVVANRRLLEVLTVSTASVERALREEKYQE